MFRSPVLESIIHHLYSENAVFVIRWRHACPMTNKRWTRARNCQALECTKESTSHSAENKCSTLCTKLPVILVWESHRDFRFQPKRRSTLLPQVICLWIISTKTSGLRFKNQDKLSSARIQAACWIHL
jgi:hypothetical protein